MKGSVGCQAKIVTVIPHMRELARGQSKELSVKAKFRLKVFDWYYQKSPAFSRTGVRNVSRTCRHFGIQRSLFYYWLKRYYAKHLASLENKSRSPNERGSLGTLNDLYRRYPASERQSQPTPPKRYDLFFYGRSQKCSI